MIIAGKTEDLVQGLDFARILCVRAPNATSNGGRRVSRRDRESRKIRTILNNSSFGFSKGGLKAQWST